MIAAPPATSRVYLTEVDVQGKTGLLSISIGVGASFFLYLANT